MTALIQRLRKEEKGLTLIELLAVIVIIGVIAAIAIPLIGGLIKDTKENARTSTANQLVEAAKLYSIAKNNGDVSGTVTLSDLEAGEYIAKGLTDPKDGKSLNSTTTKVDLTTLMKDAPVDGDVIVVLNTTANASGDVPITRGELKSSKKTTKTETETETETE